MDGFKEAFSAPALEKSSISAERETPIDRWMGWNVAADKAVTGPSDAEFIDAMSADSYITVSLKKPMGIIFEENDVTPKLNPGGIYVFELTPGGAAEAWGGLEFGDQLVGVLENGEGGSKKSVAGLDFDLAINAIKEGKGDELTLVLFRGSSEALYGPTGASKEWIEEFVGGIEC
ncbi:hypothetical protein TrVE_jg319 [Triparma verrucosa]|uniref:PDZ domain-containing protein n=1 Tax=Triparma verrucosa TaxID=1606542 RepID=A0A9W7ENW1_9STRA|nr:hypothetical protein TrVE_jg319 [Triparma verrucosa]